MKNRKLINGFLCLMLGVNFMLTTSCKQGESTGQGTDNTTEASGSSSKYDETSNGDAAGAQTEPAQQSEGAAKMDTTTTTNNGNSTAKGSGL